MSTCMICTVCLSVCPQFEHIDIPTFFSCRPWFFLQPGYWRPRRSTAPKVRQHSPQRRRASSTNPEEGLVNGDAEESLDPDVAAEAARVWVHDALLWMPCLSCAYDCSYSHASGPMNHARLCVLGQLRVMLYRMLAYIITLLAMDLCSDQS